MFHVAMLQNLSDRHHGIQHFLWHSEEKIKEVKIPYIIREEHSKDKRGKAYGGKSTAIDFRKRGGHSP